MAAQRRTDPSTRICSIVRTPPKTLGATHSLKEEQEQEQEGLVVLPGSQGRGMTSQSCRNQTRCCVIYGYLMRKRADTKFFYTNAWK